MNNSLFFNWSHGWYTKNDDAPCKQFVEEASITNFDLSTIIEVVSYFLLLWFKHQFNFDIIWTCMIPI